MEYNVQRSNLILKEYGRNVQRLVEYVKAIDDKEKKQKLVTTLVELMKIINVDLNRNGNSNDQKVWDDLHIIFEYQLDVETPYPKPAPKDTSIQKKRSSYSNKKIKYKHYGKNIELLIEGAITISDEKEQKGAIIAIGKLMRGLYETWNRENIGNKQIIEHLDELSGNKLTFDLKEADEFGVFDSERSGNNYKRRTGSSNTSYSKKNKKGFSKKPRVNQ